MTLQLPKSVEVGAEQQQSPKPIPTQSASHALTLPGINLRKADAQAHLPGQPLWKALLSARRQPHCLRPQRQPQVRPQSGSCVPAPPRPATTCLLSVPVDLPVLYTSQKWNPPPRDVLCLASLVQRHVLRFIHAVAGVGAPLLFPAESQDWTPPPGASQPP